MIESISGQVEQVKIIGPDYALAYSALARRVAAVDALMRSGSIPIPGTILHNAKVEIEEAMRVINQLETPTVVMSACCKETH